MDNLKKVKRDRERVAITQPHEIASLRKAARRILEQTKKAKTRNVSVPKITVRRFAKAILKLTKK